MTPRLTVPIVLLISTLMCGTSPKDTIQFTANCELKQQSPLSPYFHKDAINFQPLENEEEPH